MPRKDVGYGILRCEIYMEADILAGTQTRLMEERVK